MTFDTTGTTDTPPSPRKKPRQHTDHVHTRNQDQAKPQEPQDKWQPYK